VVESVDQRFHCGVPPSPVCGVGFELVGDDVDRVPVGVAGQVDEWTGAPEGAAGAGSDEQADQIREVRVVSGVGQVLRDVSRLEPDGGAVVVGSRGVECPAS
jgi:hypothetical protein